MLEKPTRLILLAIMATAVFGIVYGVSTATSNENNDIYAQYLAMVEMGGADLTAYDLEGNKLESQQIRSAVVADIESEGVVIEKGGFAKFTVSVSHAATPEGYGSLTIVMPGTSMGSSIIEEFAVSKYSDEELDEIIQSKIDTPGIHNTNDFVLYTPSTVVLGANETRQVEMLIAIPPTWPDSLTNKPLNFSFTFDVVGRGPGIATQDDAIDVTVVEQE